MLNNGIEKSNFLEKNDHDLENKLLGKKKLRLVNLVEAASIEKFKNKRNSSTRGENKSDIDSSQDSDDELDNYKNLISGKINLKNVLNNFKDQVGDNIKLKSQNSTKNIIHKDNLEIKDPSQNISRKLLNLLPAPKKKISDKINLSNINFNKNKNTKQNFFQIGDKFRELANPDSDLLHSDSTRAISVNSLNNFHTNMNTYTINIEDQIDKNWELKYLRNLQDDEEKETIEPTREQTNKNHIKALISEHNKAKAVKQAEHDATSSKYGKISTKNKYGW